MIIDIKREDLNTIADILIRYKDEVVTGDEIHVPGDTKYTINIK